MTKITQQHPALRPLCDLLEQQFSYLRAQLNQQEQLLRQLLELLLESQKDRDELREALKSWSVQQRAMIETLDVLSAILQKSSSDEQDPPDE
tara:strand:+ start:552 stop:827 length:276 start_codon:yes stop_codon:yes gene_type:complete